MCKGNGKGYCIITCIHTGHACVCVYTREKQNRRVEGGSYCACRRRGCVCNTCSGCFLFITGPGYEKKIMLD